MESYVTFNDKFFKSHEPLIVAGNRGLRYGDGVFETMKIVNGEINLSAYHFERLFQGLQLLQFQLPSYFNAAYLTQQVAALCKKNQHGQLVRIRLMVFRGNGGLYDPQNHLPNYIIESWDLSTTYGQLNENGLVVDIYPDAKKAIDKFSNLKSNNYLPYAMAALYAKQHHLNDCLLLNSNNNICDATIANIFIIKDDIVVTPPLMEACVAGVMRRHLITGLPALGYKVFEKILTEKDVEDADEIFLTNAMYGMRWVKQCGLKQYSNKITTSIYNALVKKEL